MSSQQQLDEWADETPDDDINPTHRGPYKPVSDDHYRLHVRQHGKVEVEPGPSDRPWLDPDVPGHIVTGWVGGSAIMFLEGAEGYDE